MAQITLHLGGVEPELIASIFNHYDNSKKTMGQLAVASRVCKRFHQPAVTAMHRVHRGRAASFQENIAGLIIALDHENIVQGMREFTTVGSVQEAIVHSLLYSGSRLHDYKGFRSVLLDIVELYCDNINIQVDGCGILSRTHPGSGNLIDRELAMLCKTLAAFPDHTQLVTSVLVCLRHITFDFQGEGCDFVGEKLHVSPDQRRRTVSNILQCIETIDALKTPAGGTMAQKTVVKSLLKLLQNVLVFLTYHLSLSGASCVDARVDSRILNVLVNNQPSVRGDRPNRSGFIQ